MLAKCFLSWYFDLSLWIFFDCLCFGLLLSILYIITWGKMGGCCCIVYTLGWSQVQTGPNGFKREGILMRFL